MTRAVPSQLAPVPAALVSRRHALVANLGDRCTLEDTSTNGTFLLPEGGEPLLARRETVTFAGCGRLGLGAPAELDQGQVVTWEAGPG